MVTVHSPLVALVVREGGSALPASLWQSMASSKSLVLLALVSPPGKWTDCQSHIT